MSKVQEHGLDLIGLSKKAGRNVTYLQQFVRKKAPKTLPMDVRLMLANELKVSVDLLGGSDPEPKEGRPRGTKSSPKPNDQIRPRVEPKVPLQVVTKVEATFLSRGKLIPVFSCPSTMGEPQVTDWMERPAQFAGAGPTFAVWVSASAGRLRAGDLAFVHPAQPADQGDAIVVMLGNRVVDLGEVIRRSNDDAVVSTAAGEMIFTMPKYRLMRIALAVFR